MAHFSVRVIVEAVTGLPLHREEGKALSDFLSGLGGSQAPPLKQKCFAVEAVSLRGPARGRVRGKDSQRNPVVDLRHGRLCCDSRRSQSWTWRREQLASCCYGS